MKKITIFGAYLMVGFGLSMFDLQSWGTPQLIGSAVVMLSVLVIDLVSFSQGVHRGVEIADGVLKKLCDERKIRVVNNG